ncbi:BatA domain-containing protein [Sphingomonas sp. CLY1604]|uniref:BatA domain-containing protein n=1 Tax=Sphingomonas sp. CLY1604 TaxID=3457786 RepID=UPI003FD7E2E5
MSFANLPLWAVIAGVPVLAGALYLLQRLRSQRRVVAFAATPLWEQVTRDPMLRIRGPRFRYWTSYALSLALVLPLWFAFAGPILNAAAGGRGFRLFYLDNSAVLAGNMAAAKRALLADVRGVAPSRRAVFLGDATATQLLAPGESTSLLAARLDRIDADPRPSSLGGWIAERVARTPGAPMPAVSYYGGWGAVEASGAAHLRYGYLAKPVPDNRGIVALGASPAASGRWSKADVLVAFAGPGNRPPGIDDFSITRGGRPIVPAGIVPAGAGRFLLRDVDADGDLLTVALRRHDGFPADDRAAVRLPDRHVIRIALSSTTPPTIRAVIAHDDAFAIVAPDEAQVVVRRAGEAFGGDRPSLTLAPVGKAAETFLFSGPAEERRDLAARLDDYGLAQIDAAMLADQMHRPISVDVADASRRAVRVWAPLFDSGSSFAKTPGMPLFVSRALRWLAGEQGWIPYAKAGWPLPAVSAMTDWPGSTPGADRGLGGQIFADDAGVLHLKDRRIAVALTDRATTLGVAAVPPVGMPVGEGRSALLPHDAPYALLMLLAILLLAGEWIAYQRHRMP